MSRHIKFFYLFITIIGIFILFPKYAHSEESVIKQGIHRGEWARYGNLQYGFSTVMDEDNSGVAPDVELITPTQDVIRHIYRSKNIEQLSSTTGFNLWTDNNISSAWRREASRQLGFRNITQGQTNFDKNSIRKTTLKDGTVLISAEAMVDYNYKIICSLWPSTATGGINTTYSIENMGRYTQTIYPAKGVDTMLNGSDGVPLYSSGPGKGIYMQTSSGNENYRMDYSMNYEKNPLDDNNSNEVGKTPYYAGGYFPVAFGTSSMFNRNYNSPSDWHMTKPDGFSLVPQGRDTAIFMYWGPIQLNPGEVFRGGYQVALKDIGNFTLTTDYINLKSQDGLNYPQDEILYRSTITAPDTTDFNTLNYQYVLSPYLDKPSKVVLDGNEYNVENVYDDTTRTITIPISKLNKNEEKKIEIATKILPSGEKKMVESKATLSGLSAVGSKKMESAISKFYVEEGPAIVETRYLDAQNQEISSNENQEVNKNSTNTITAKKIPGYKVIGASINGNEMTLDANNSINVSVKDRDTSVVFHYQSIHFGETTPLLEVNKKNVSLGDTLSYKLSVKSGMIYSAGATPKNFSNFKVTVPMDANLENIKNIQLKLSDGAVVGTGKVDTTNNAIVATLSKDVKDTENLFLTYDASVKQSAAIGTAIKQTAEVKSDFDANGIKTYSVQSNTVESIVERQLAVKINYLDVKGKKLADSISKIGFVGATYDYTSDMKKIDKYKFPPKEDEKNNPISGTFEPNKDVTINLLYDLDLATIMVKFENDSGMDMSKYNYSFSTQFGETIDLSSNNEINKQVIEIEQAGYSVTPPNNVKNFPVDDHEITVIYKVIGKLELKEWPSEVDFGTQKVSTTKKNYWPTMKKNLVVRDTRGSKNSPWQLTVSETAPLTVGTTKLEGVLSYQTSTRTPPETLNKSAVTVENNTNASDGEFNISGNWSKENGKGIKATIPVEKQKIGTYKGTLSWSLVSAPGNP